MYTNKIVWSANAGLFLITSTLIDLERKTKISGKWSGAKHNSVDLPPTLPMPNQETYCRDYDLNVWKLNSAMPWSNGL